MNDMRKIMESIEQLDESAGATVYVGFHDERYEGFWPIEEWETTSDVKWAKQQADKLAVDRSDDINIVVVEFIAGRTGHKRVYEAKGGVDITAAVKSHDNAKLYDGVNEAVIEPTDEWEKKIGGMKSLIDDFEWRFEGMAYQAKIQGHAAAAASLINIEADIHHIQKLFDAARADLGKDYDRPGGWPEGFDS